MLLEHMTWAEVDDYLKKDDRIILPTASCEEHGRHMPLGNDSITAYTIAGMLGERANVLVAPPMAYGMSMPLIDFPGTLSLQASTFQAAVMDILYCLYRQGFRRVFVVNGHGENSPCLEAIVPQALSNFPGLQIKIRTWFTHPKVVAMVEESFTRPDGHAGANETSVCLYLRPDLVKMELAEGVPPVRQAIFYGP
ncbi:MAG: creatininase family protein, partial [Dehalococcoidia bacterium]|nr:creatininase family protein [Dehalococcoidia bacterium]